MTHIDIYKKFLKICPIIEDTIECWFQNGKNSIRVRMKNKKEIVFTVYSSNKWKIESMDLHISEMKELRKGEK